MMIIFFFNDTATTEIYTLSLHDALPICLTAVPETPDLAETSCWISVMQSAVTWGLVSGLSKLSCSVAAIVLLSQQRVPGETARQAIAAQLPPGPYHGSAPACRPLRVFSHCYLFRLATRPEVALIGRAARLQWSA